MADLTITTPWRWQEFGGEYMLVGGTGAKVILCASRKGVFLTRDPADGRLRDIKMEDANIAFIPLACNAHADLVATLKDAQAAIAYTVRGSIDAEDLAKYRATSDKIDAALAKAGA